MKSIDSEVLRDIKDTLLSDDVDVRCDKSKGLSKKYIKASKKIGLKEPEELCYNVL